MTEKQKSKARWGKWLVRGLIAIGFLMFGFSVVVCWIFFHQEWSGQPSKILTKRHLFRPGDFKDALALSKKLSAHNDPVSQGVWSLIDPSNQSELRNPPLPNESLDDLKQTLTDSLNGIVNGPTIYDPTRFEAVNLSEKTKELLPARKGIKLAQLNRMLLQDAYKQELEPPPQFTVSFFEHIDWDSSHFVDVFIGVCGIFIGLIIAILVEHKNAAHTEYVTAALGHVETAAKFGTVTEYTKLLENIEKVLDHAKTYHNDLFIINPTASFGFFLTFDLDVVAASTQPGLPTRGEAMAKCSREFLKSQTMKDFAAAQEKLVEQKGKNYENLLAVARQKKRENEGTIHYATLSPRKVKFKDVERSFYEKEFAAPATETKSAVGKEKGSEAKVVIKWYDEGEHGEDHVGEFLEVGNQGRKAFGKCFLVNSRDYEGPVNNSDEQTNLRGFIEILDRDQKERISAMRKADIEVSELKAVPLQLFLSWPPEHVDEPYGETMCLVVFSNKYNLGQTDNIAAFTTTRPEVANVFRDMWKVIVDREKDRGDSQPTKQAIPTV